MATVIDPGQGALAQALGRAGERIAGRVFEKENRERELSADVTNLIQLAPAARLAIEAGQSDMMAETLRVRPEFITHIAQLPETLAQEIERGFRKGGGAELTVDAQVAGLERSASEDTFNTNIFTSRTEGGLERLIVSNDLLAEENRTLNLGLEETSLTRYTDYFNNLIPGTHEYETAVIALSNPAELQHISQHEARDLEASLREATLTAQSEGEVFSLTLQMQDRMNAAVDRLAKHEADGAPKDVIDQAKVDVENMRLLNRTLMDAGKILPFVNTGASGRRGRFQLNFEGIQSELVINSLRQLEAEINHGSPLDGEEGILAGIESAAAGMLPIEREDFLARANAAVERYQQEVRDEQGSVWGGLTQLTRLGAFGRGPQKAVELTGEAVAGVQQLIRDVSHLLGTAATGLRSIDVQGSQGTPLR